MKFMYQHITIIIVIALILIIYCCNSNTYTEKQVIGISMSFPENVLPKNKHLLASDASGNLELVDLNRLITEFEAKMNYIQANSKGDKGDKGDSITGLRGPKGDQGSNANCVRKGQAFALHLQAGNRRIGGGGHNQIKHLDYHGGADWNTFIIR